ncbi:MAG: glycosyltransferase family 1 protein [bacterium]|nr:glycosyltransferase family 1 protein [bacterium]
MSSSKIKIAIMSDVIDRRPERAVYGRRLVENLLKHPELDIYLIHYKKMPDDPLYDRVHEILIPLMPLPWASHFFSFIWFCLTTKEKFDIVHWLVNRPYPFFWWIPTKKTVVTVHGGTGERAPHIFTIPNLFFNFFLRHFNHHMDAAIAVSEYGNKEAIYDYHILPEKVFTIYNGIDPIYRQLSENVVRQTLKKYNVNFEKYFLYLGGLQTHKNVKRLVEAYILLRDSRSIKEKLIIIGRTSYGAKEVHGTALNSKYSSDILFINYVSLEDSPAFYCGATALVFPSLNEGFGLPVVEAMSCGIPVITSDSTSLPEVSGGAAILINPYKVEEIMNAMRKIVENENLRKEMVVKGIIRAKIFTWEKHVEETLILYKKILNTDQS